MQIFPEHELGKVCVGERVLDERGLVLHPGRCLPDIKLSSRDPSLEVGTQTH
jgi:hypothetical protein